MEALTKLAWRCRRGTLELDLLLQHYLDHEYLQADVVEQAQFSDLLALEDDVLQAYLLENKPVASDSLKQLTEKIKLIKVNSLK